MKPEAAARHGAGHLTRRTVVSRMNPKTGAERAGRAAPRPASVFGKNPPGAPADVWGVVRGFRDAEGRWQRTAPETRRALHAAMHADHDPLPREDAVRVEYAGRPIRIHARAELRLEDGSVWPAPRGELREVPAGCHELQPLDGGPPTWLIVAPPACPLPANLRAWGWAVQLYAARSRASWGFGDFADLRALARWAGRELDAGFLLLNPLGAPLPVLPLEASPYLPGSRLFLNPLYLRIEEVPGARTARLPLARLAEAGRALNAGRLIDRDAVWRLKSRALEILWRRFPGDPRFDRFCAAGGEPLRQYATFCVLAGEHESGWTRWPARFRRPDSPAVREFAGQRAHRVRYHQWLQWLLDEQLGRAARALPLLHDVPIGVRPDGFDAWLWQDLLALDAAVGAPPDPFSRSGQDWGLPPFIPHRLRAAGYEPLRRTLRHLLRHAGGLRLDHVMGLFRLFWIPRGAPASQGTYVRYRAEELLAVVALESQRAGAVIVGEDLGTVEPGMRAALRRRRILSYRLLWFERRQPRRFPRRALAALTTHDLFTVAGLWTGQDLAAQKRLGLPVNERDTAHIRRRLARVAGLPPSASAVEAVRRAHRALARAPSALLAATLEDALAVTERPNLPGTTTQWPNWRLALPVPLEALRRHPLARAVARAMRR